METYVTSTELKKELRRVKELAREDVVHVLENGHAGYVLCSAEVFERRVTAARAQAAWEAVAHEVLREGAMDAQKGHVAPWGTDARVLMTEYAQEQIDTEYSGEPALLEDTLARVADEPSFGLCVEYDGEPEHANARRAYKVLVPPNDLLYWWSPEDGSVLVCGLVRALEAQ